MCWFLSWLNRISDVLWIVKQSSGTCGQTVSVMMDICSWTGDVSTVWMCSSALNVGYYHFLFEGHLLWKTNDGNLSRWGRDGDENVLCSFIFIFQSGQKHNLCWSRCWKLQGETVLVSPFFRRAFTHTPPFTHITETWLGSNQQPLNPWGSALTCEPQVSCWSMWRNLYLTVDLWVPNKEVKVSCVWDLNPCFHHKLILREHVFIH